MPRRLLLVDSDAARAARLARLGAALGWTVARARGIGEAVAQLGAQPFDLCLLDLSLPAGEASAVVLKARACRPAVVTAAIDTPRMGRIEVLRAGAAAIVPRPRRRADLAALAARLLDGTAHGRASMPPLVVGDDPALARALAQLDALARSDQPVLVRGETGTGKATTARLLHAASARRQGRFVAINLAAVPVERAELQLAGRGLPCGWLAAARGGTLFLDELDLLTARAQAALVARLQAARPTVRIVGATRHTLAHLIERGALHPVLGDRLAGSTIELPPLRARRADIPSLAEHFRRQVNAREGRRVPGFALDVMRRFAQHSWPGNVRELQNLVERLVITAGTRMVVMRDLPSHLRMQVLDFERAAQELSPDGIDPRQLLAELEAQFIAEALRAPSDGDSPTAAPDSGGLFTQKSRRRIVA